MKKKILVLCTAIGLVSATPAFAAHEHYLVTPGKTICNIAKGQTSIADPNHGGYHKFHENVHISDGSPSIANGKTSNVLVFKGECPSN
ncbi:hypothetical protein [Bacillus sp. FJAT-29814]|uniref:hypothetical protein n=1 Tax=Bacillus sp. FJAT-29814 TaxID=1729688 RepID=UPI0008295434|nr:hypothetical protein [Bacillus sp. FJAT-29814]